MDQKAKDLPCLPNTKGKLSCKSNSDSGTQEFDRFYCFTTAPQYCKSLVPVLWSGIIHVLKSYMRLPISYFAISVLICAKNKT